MAGNLTVEQYGSVFASASRKASANCGIGTDGRVGLHVEKVNRSRRSSNAANDNSAAMVEIANDEFGGNWHVSDTAPAIPPFRTSRNFLITAALQWHFSPTPAGWSPTCAHLIISRRHGTKDTVSSLRLHFQ